MCVENNSNKGDEIMEYRKEQWEIIIAAFKNYENKFKENLYYAWDFDAVDWLEYAKIVDSCVKSGVPITDEQREQFIETFEPGVVY